MKKINLACGGKLCLLPGWENIDFQNSGKNVWEMDLTKKLKFEDDSIDVIYHSQFIEHLSHDQGLSFFKECFRILKKGGIMRIVTPDLENQMTEYLSLIKEIKKRKNNDKLILKYKWIKLEILDQLARNQSGGEQVKFLKKNKENIREYIENRLGRSGRDLLDHLGGTSSDGFFKKIAKKIYYTIKNSGSYYSKIGKFRLGGEIHYTVFDSVDLNILLKEAGFNSSEVMAYDKSNIPDWNLTELDRSSEGFHDGKNCLFIEVIK